MMIYQTFKYRVIKSGEYFTFSNSNSSSNSSDAIAYEIHSS